MKRMNKKGFTMAELLIVVAIIAVLVAIAIPVFTTQLEKSREATDIANIRSGYAEATTAAITDTTGNSSVITIQSSGAFDYEKGDNLDAQLKAALPASVTKGDTYYVHVKVSGGTKQVAIDTSATKTWE